MRYSSCLLAWATAVSAQSSLQSALTSQQDLSRLLTLGSSLPAFASLLNATNITILAPTNEAFEAIDNNTALGRAVQGNDTTYLSAFLSYHVLMGTYNESAFESSPRFVHTLLNSTAQVNGQALANVTGGQYVELLRNGNVSTILSGNLAESNVTGSPITIGGNNGITIHKINRVLSIPDTASNTALAAGQNVAVAALILANLAQAIDTTGDQTIFVPNNEAFNNIGSALLAASPQDLASVLEYHVVEGSVLFTTSASNTTIRSRQGGNLTVTVENDEVFINNARVVVPNILIRNGAAHLINGVLNPSNTSVVASSLPTSGTAPAAFTSASSVDLPFTSTLSSASSTITIPAIVTNAPQTSQAASSSGSSESTSASATSNFGPMMTAAANLVGAGLFVAGAFVV